MSPRQEAGQLEEPSLRLLDYGGSQSGGTPDRQNSIPKSQVGRAV